MSKRAIGWGALALAGALCAMTAHAAPAADQAAPMVAGTGGFGMAGFAAGAGGIAFDPIPFSDLAVVNAGAGIPVGGALLLTGGGTTSMPIIEVASVDTPNTTLGGTIRQFESSQYWTWVPSEPFEEGATYQVRLSAPDIGFFGVTSTFEILPALELAKPELVGEPSASTVAETNNLACCRSFFGGGVLEESSCFPNEQRRSVMVSPGLSTPDSSALLGQFLFRIGPDGATAGVAQATQWPTSVPVMFYEQADEYCFSVEAIELVSGTVHTYEDLSRCAQHGDLADVGIVELEAGVAELDRSVCPAPPLAYEEQWCELNEEPCADDEDESGCGLYGYVCRDEALPPDPFSNPGFSGASGFGIGGMGIAGAGFGASGGIAGLAGGSGGRGGSGGDSSMSEGGDDGCSVASVPTGGGTGHALAWGAAAALLLSARRKRRAARA